MPDPSGAGGVAFAAKFKGDDVRLLGDAGQNTPFQFSRVKRDKDGTILSARLSFYAELGKNGSYRFELVPGTPAKPAAPPTAGEKDGYLTLDNGITAIRLPAGKKQFAKPLTMAADHATAMKALGDMGKAGLAFGPIAGVRLADGRWVGGSYFTTESIQAVRLRQGYRKNPLDAQDISRALASAPKMTGYQAEITEQGPLFVEARIRFTFDQDRYYQLTARVLANDPAIRIDEIMDFRTNCPPDDPLYVVMLLNSGWKDDGWKPDAAFVMSNRRDLHSPFEAAIKQHGFASRFASLPVTYAEDGAVITDLVSHDPWGPRAHYLGLVDVDELTAAKTCPFLAVVPMHSGSWRADHWVFPPKEPHLFQQLMTWKDGSMGMCWTMRAQPHPQDVLHTGEFDAATGLTLMRRLWCMIGGPFRYHDALHPFRTYEGYVNLDHCKDWNLAWSDDTKKGVQLPPTATSDQRGPLWHLNAALMGDDRSYPWFSHYRQSEAMEWAVGLRRQLADERLPPERRGRLQAEVAAFCYLMADPDFNTRASMSHQGNPNMPINRFFALPFAAVLISDHPMAKTWLDTSADYVRYKLGMNVAPGGSWGELISYYGASAPTLVHGALSAYWQKRVDEATRRLAAAPVNFTLQLLAPPDPRFGARVVPGFGHEGNLIFNQWTPAAALLRDLDPDKAAAFVWAWDQQKRPMGAQHDNGFSTLAGDQSDLLKRATSALLRTQVRSTWFPGFGAVLHSHPGDPRETYLAFRQGYQASHSDANQGDFIIYAKGAPLTTMSLFGYAIRQQPEYIKINNEFGWHSRVRFADQKDDGGWPGGGSASGVHRHYFSDSMDYLRAFGDYSSTRLKTDDPNPRDLSAPDALRWTRQVIFLKDATVNGPNYFVFRDSFRNLHGKPANLPTTWWYQRTLGSKNQVQASDRGFDYTSQWNTRMQVRFLQPAQVSIESREVRGSGALYGFLSKAWREAGSPTGGQDGNTISETLTINAAGPVPAGRDVMVLIYPRGKDEPAPKHEALADGAVKVTTAKSTDYVFANPDGMTFKQGDVAFSGVAGTVRVFANEVHMAVAEGAATISFKGYTLKAGQPATKIVSMAEINKGGTVEVPPPKPTITFTLDEKAGKIEQLAPGVRKQTLPNGVAFEFNAEKPIMFEKDQVVFVGTRGGIIADEKAGTTRLVLIEGEKIGYGNLKADVATGPYDLTFFSDKVTGVTEGPARLLRVTLPDGIRQLPSVTINGAGYAPGTFGNVSIIAVNDGRTTFTLGNLKQPPVFRSWQEW